MTVLVEQLIFCPLPRAGKSCFSNRDILKVNMWGLKGDAKPAVGEGQG